MKASQNTRWSLTTHHREGVRSVHVMVTCFEAIVEGDAVRDVVHTCHVIPYNHRDDYHKQRAHAL